jgi:hypothetical protein
MAEGRLKVFSSLQNWRSEFRIYRRDKNGKVVKSDDHLMDASRYLLMPGLRSRRRSRAPNSPIMTLNIQIRRALA